MDHELDRGIAVRRTGGAPDAYDADLDPGWTIGGGLNGGYLLTVVGNAVRASLAQEGQPDPVAVSAHYLSASRPGPARVDVRRVRTGRGLSTVAASLLQDDAGADTERLAVLATYGDLGRLGDEVATTAVEPDLPPVEECVATTDAPGEVPPLLHRLDLRLTPDSVGWALGAPSGRGVIEGWFRLADRRPLDALALLLVVDALPPATFDLGRPGWAPTVQLSVQVRARPAPGWVKVRHATRNVAGGYFEEDCEVWDGTGRLVAQSRQLARTPRPVPAGSGFGSVTP